MSIRIDQGAQWWLGDWLNYGERKYGEMYSQALELYEAETLRKFQWVAKEVTNGRRRPELSWGHHREVAPLEPKEQKKWLDIAENEELSVHRLRNKIKKEKKNELKKQITGLPKGKYRIIYADLYV